MIFEISWQSVDPKPKFYQERGVSNDFMTSLKSISNDTPRKSITNATHIQG